MQNKKYYSFFTLLPYLWLATGMLIYKNGDKAMLVLIVISIISTFLIHGASTVKENILKNHSSWIITLVAIYAVFQYFYQGISSREVRSLVASALLIMTFPRALLTQKFLTYLALIGSILCFLYTFYNAEYLSIDRSTWSINAIPYATLTATFGVIALSQLSEKCKVHLKIHSIFILVLTFFTLVINETRGVLVAFMAVVLYFSITTIKLKEIKLKHVVFAFILLAILALLTKPFLKERYRNTLNEISLLKNNNQSTSIGLRLQMWKSTPYMIQGSYVLGLGDNHSQRIDELYKQGLISQTLYDFHPNDYHNQYLNWLIKHGIIGLILTSLLIFSPLYFAKHGSAFQKKYIKGIVILFATASLTDVSLHQGQTIFMFCFLAYSVSPRQEKP